MAMKGKNPLTIKELMRHKSIASTMIYTKLSPEHLREESEDLDYGPMPVGTKKED
jgi:site-specific recombinase XerD